MSKMFKNVHYNFKSNKYTVWEVEDGKTRKIEDYLKHYYYVKDPDGISPTTDIHGTPVIRRETDSKDKMLEFKKTGVYMCESDINPEIKILHMLYGNEQMKADVNDFNIAYLDIEIEVGDVFPEPTLADFPINLITVKSSKTGEVYTFGTSEFTKTSSEYVGMYAYIPDELDMLRKFVAWFRKHKFDIIAGWNVGRFDIMYIVNRIKKLEEGLELKLSPVNKITLNKVTNEYRIEGISVLDMLELYKNFTFVTRSSYSLQSIATIELGEGKIDLDGQITTIFKTDWNKFVEYNVQDVLLLEKLEKKLRFIALTISFCSQALIPLERIYSSIHVITGYILNHLHEHGMVLPDKKSRHYDWWKEEEMHRYHGELQNVKEDEKLQDGTDFPEFYVKGGHVEAKPGFYKHLLSFDATSLYPTNIRMFNISPETKVIKPTSEQMIEMDLITSCVNGVYYKKTEGVLPTIITRIFNERKMFKKKMFDAYNSGNKQMAEYYDSQQMIRKILINSMYGVLANKNFHLFDVDNARAITRAGRVAIRYLAQTTDTYLKQNWHKIYTKYFPEVENPKPLTKDLYVVIDTDSNYFCLDEIKEHYAPDMDFHEFALKMETEFFDPFIKRIFDIFAEKRNAPNLLDFKREGVILKQFVLAKKKYITELVADEDKVYDPPVIKAKGVETVRSSTPAYNRKTIMDVIRFMFDNTDKEAVLDLLREKKIEFDKQPEADIASVSSIKEYDKYGRPGAWYVKNDGPDYPKGATQRAKASIAYNYLIKKYQLPYVEVCNGTKIKYIYVDPMNECDNNTIAFIGSQYPPEFSQLFKVDKDLQFEKTFLSVIQRMFDVLEWGRVDLTRNSMESFFI